MTTPIISVEIELKRDQVPTSPLLVAKHLGGHGASGDPYRVTGPLVEVVRFVLSAKKLDQHTVSTVTATLAEVRPVTASIDTAFGAEIPHANTYTAPQAPTPGMDGFLQMLRAVQEAAKHFGDD